jgi:excisionase family DNA binding protein
MEGRGNEAVKEQLLTAAEAAHELRCNEKTVRKMIGRGEIPAVMVAGRWLIRPQDLPTRMPPRRLPSPRPRKIYGEGIAAQAARELDERLAS